MTNLKTSLSWHVRVVEWKQLNHLIALKQHLGKRYHHLTLPIGGALILLIAFLLLSKSSKNASVEQQILDASEEWIGTPYQWGGSSKEGIDCSAFTQVIIKEVFDIDIPRRVKNQKKFGTRVNRDELEAGDLVFFKTGGLLSSKQHIGIYLSDDDFVHASTSDGVTISSLDEWFWNKKYRYGRRLVDDHGASLLVSNEE